MAKDGETKKMITEVDGLTCWETSTCKAVIRDGKMVLRWTVGRFEDRQ
jgi:hypothetical protein